MKFYEDPKEREGKQEEQEEEDNSDYDDASTATEPCTSEEENDSENEASFDVSDHEKNDSLNNKSKDNASYVNPLFSIKIQNQDINSVSTFLVDSCRGVPFDAEPTWINRQRDQEAQVAVVESSIPVFFFTDDEEIFRAMTAQDVTANRENSENNTVPTPNAYYYNF